MLAFAAFAGVSCWATAESLHLLLPSWPLIMCWVVTIGFFFIASWGSKMIVDSLNQKIYLEKRGLRLCGGIFILLVFWLIMSMPTNTHTFFYRSAINDKVTGDISTTNAYLAQIRDGVVTENSIKLRIAKLNSLVEAKLIDLEHEIMQEENPGFGPQATESLRQFASILGVEKVDPISFKGNPKSQTDLRNLCNRYRAKIKALQKQTELDIRSQMTPKSDNHKKQAAVAFQNIELVKKYIDDGTLNLNSANDVKDICDKLNQGYSTIRTNQQFVDFKDEADRVAYTSPNAVTKVSRMLSVYDVWKGYMNGEYAGRGFLFWILVSILVDVAAFIFFDIAFKKRED